MSMEQAAEMIRLLTQIRNEVNRIANNTQRGGGYRFYTDPEPNGSISGAQDTAS